MTHLSPRDEVHAGHHAQLTHDDLARQIARLIERGLLRVTAEARELTVSTPFEPFGATEHEPEPRAMVEEEDHCDDDEGLSGVRCEITLPTGQKSSSQPTNRFGILRVEGIGSTSDYTVKFPDLDTEAWEAIA